MGYFLLKCCSEKLLKIPVSFLTFALQPHAQLEIPIKETVPVTQLMYF